MADFRQIHTRIWKDDWFSNLETDAKLLFIYLFSNEQAEVSGVYELPIKYMAFESDLPKERILELLQQFEDAGKVVYRNGWVWVVNLRKYNETGSVPVAKRIKKDLDAMPTGELKEMYCKYHLIPYPYGVETVPIPDLNDDVIQNGDRNREDTDETNPPLFQPCPELELYHEVTGLYPDYSKEDEVKRNVGEIQKKHRLPRDQVLELMEKKYTEWCGSFTSDGKPYSRSNPKWLEWCITGQGTTAKSNGSQRKNRLITGV
jgi:hypothetical protein